MWTDDFPHGDVMFLGDIFHDWPLDACRSLAKKCYLATRPGGMIVLHEMLFDDDKSGPFLTSAYNMKMMLWTQGQQLSYHEAREILILAGYSEIIFHNSLGNWSLVTGRKTR